MAMPNHTPVFSDLINTKIKNSHVIKECKILKHSEDDIESHNEEMQKILNLAAKNAVNHKNYLRLFGK